MVIVSRDVQVNEVSEWDWNNSTEVDFEVGESSIVAPTITPTDSEIFYDEDDDCVNITHAGAILILGTLRTSIIVNN